MKPRKRAVKRQSDNRKITVSVPEELYFHIKHFAKDEIRTISQQARLFIEIGLEVMAQQNQQIEETPEPEEKPSCIGFQIDRSGDDDEE